MTQATDHPIRFVLAPPSDIQWAIDSSYRAIGGVDQLVEAFEAVEGTRRKDDSGEAEVVADDAPIVQVVTRILTQAKRDRARTSTSSRRRTSSGCGSGSMAH